MTIDVVQDLGSTVQYIATAGQTVFPVPFPFVNNTDILVYAGTVKIANGTDYNVTGAGNDTGGSLTLTVGAVVNTVYTVVRDIAIERLTEYQQNGPFTSAAINAELDNIVLIEQQLADQVGRAIRIPVTSTAPSSALELDPVSFNGAVLTLGSDGRILPGVFSSTPITQATLGPLIYPRSALEIAGGVTPTNYIYPYGCPRRFGALGTGGADETPAVQTAMNTSSVYYAWPGDEYQVSQVVAGPNLSEVKFNGSELIGNATVTTNSVLHITTNFCTFDDIVVNGGSYLGVNPNPNYDCLVWWYRAGAPSQFNTINGMELFNGVYGLVYGGLPGQPSTTVVHSENEMYNFRSSGVSNPIFVNSSTGFLHCYGSTFFRDASSWTNPTLPASARAYEVLAGNLYIHGGEVIASNSTLGYSVAGAAIVNGTYFELSAPMHATLDNGRFSGCRFNVLNQGVNLVVVDAAATGVLAFSNCTMLRPAGTGATDRTPMVDGTAAPSFEVDMNSCTSFEWGFAMAGANCKLIQGCIARYSNHRLSITAADPHVYLLNSPRIGLVPELTLDHMGYTTTGWVLETISGGGTTLTNTTNAGPTGYLASQLTLHATGQSRAWSGDPTSLATLKSTAQRVKPNSLFWLFGQMKSNGGTVQLLSSFYDLTGAAISTVTAADATSIGSGSWVAAEGPVAAPANAAYMIFGVQGIVSDVQFTDVILQKA